MKPPTTHPEAAEEQAGFFSGWSRFWFAPSDPFGLHLIRFLTGLLLLAWLLPLAGQVDALFGLQGWFDRQAFVQAAKLNQQTIPKPITRDSWSLLYPIGANPAALLAFYWGSIAVLVLFTLGVAARLTAIAAWLIVVSFTASPVFDMEADPLLLMLTLYLAVGYLLLGQWRRGWNPLQRVLGSGDWIVGWRWFHPSDSSSRASEAATLALRLIQVHLAVILVTTGLTKLQIAEWWSGVAHWYNLYTPLSTTMESLRARARDGDWFIAQLNVMAYATIAWQIFFPTFAWRSGWWRLLLLGGAVVGWIGLATLYRIPNMGPALLIGCLSYISATEWGKIGQGLSQISSLRRVAELLPNSRESTWTASQTEAYQTSRGR